LTLAAVGLYGVMAHSVAQRTQEIGVRMALGARRAHIVGLVAREGAFLTAGGLLIGIAVALAVSRLLAGMLYEVSPNDPLALVAAAVLLGAAAVLATAVPVRRAMRVDPMQALRDE
jgi:putative ABC transport system permease protein